MPGETSGRLRLCFSPSAARNIQVHSPYEIRRAPDELHYTYLDTFGRPVIAAYKQNLVEQHIQDIVVSGPDLALVVWGCGQAWSGLPGPR